jgi:hypothetical protein
MATQNSVAIRLIDALRGLCGRIVRQVEDASGAAPIGRYTADPWDAGYQAGRRAGYRAGAEAAVVDMADHRAPYPDGSTAAGQWWQGFRIGLCDGAEERR